VNLHIKPEFRSTVVLQSLQIPEQRKDVQKLSMSDFSLNLVLQFKDKQNHQ